MRNGGPVINGSDRHSAGGSPDASDADRAAIGPTPVPVSAADNPLPSSADTLAEASGRKILSTAFVMIGPDGLLTVGLRDGRTLVLKDVVMRPKDYCGALVAGGKAGARFCGAYGDVAAARPGSATSLK